jgi:F5/8 type C domain/Domain of unknown function (DUF5668)
MGTKREVGEAKAKRQARVAKAVWGTFLMVVGVLFSLENLGRIDLGAPVRHTPGHAVDGNPATRWASAFRDDQWFTVDLGSPTEIRRIRLNWEAAYAKKYRIEVAEDPTLWTTLVEVADGDGDVDEHEVSTQARYVRVTGTDRATPFGYSLWEVEVYGGLDEALVSRGRTATASTTEPVNYWLIYWPLLLIVGGLAPLLAPKDGGDQVVGFAMVGAGAFLQLRNLDLVGWTLREAAPVLLIAAGLMMVLQALRRLKKNGTTPGFDVPPDAR